MWTGLGAAGTAVVGMWALGESVSVIKLVSIGPMALLQQHRETCIEHSGHED